MVSQSNLLHSGAGTFKSHRSSWKSLTLHSITIAGLWTEWVPIARLVCTNIIRLEPECDKCTQNHHVRNRPELQGTKLT